MSTRERRRRESPGQRTGKKLIRLWIILTGIVVLLIFYSVSLYRNFSQPSALDLKLPSSVVNDSASSILIHIPNDSLFYYNDIPLSLSEIEDKLKWEINKTGNSKDLIIDIQAGEGVAAAKVVRIMDIALRLDITARLVPN